MHLWAKYEPDCPVKTAWNTLYSHHFQENLTKIHMYGAFRRDFTVPQHHKIQRKAYLWVEKILAFHVVPESNTYSQRLLNYVDFCELLLDKIPFCQVLWLVCLWICLWVCGCVGEQKSGRSSARIWTKLGQIMYLGMPHKPIDLSDLDLKVKVTWPKNRFFSTMLNDVYYSISF